MAQEPPQDKGRPQKQQLTAQGQNAQSGASAIAQTLSSSFGRKIINAATGRQEKKMQFKKPEEEKPEPQKRVVVIVSGFGEKTRATVAEYIPPHTVRSEGFLSEDCESGELDTYDEKEDTYYVNEGWFESNLYDENSFHITHKILAWAYFEIPEEYKSSAQNQPTTAPMPVESAPNAGAMTSEELRKSLDVAHEAAKHSKLRFGPVASA